MSSYIKGNEIVIKTAEQLMAFARDCRLAALKEVREMVADRREASRIAWSNCEGSPDFQRSFGDYVREDDEVLKQIDALIKREEEGR